MTYMFIDEDQLEVDEFATFGWISCLIEIDVYEDQFLLA